MKNIAIFYASSSGHTKEVAHMISTRLDEIKEYNINVTGSEFMNDYDNIILGVATYEDGSLQDDWQNIWDEFKHIDFTNKYIAIFGLGDQRKYPENFCDAMGTLYEQVLNAGGTVVGYTSTKGFEFEDSKALLSNDLFVGLTLDLENQKELTELRIQAWTEILKNKFL